MHFTYSVFAVSAGLPLSPTQPTCVWAASEHKWTSQKTLPNRVTCTSASSVNGSSVRTMHHTTIRGYIRATSDRLTPCSCICMCQCVGIWRTSAGNSVVVLGSWSQLCSYTNIFLNFVCIKSSMCVFVYNHYCFLTLPTFRYSVIPCPLNYACFCRVCTPFVHSSYAPPCNMRSCDYTLCVVL